MPCVHAEADLDVKHDALADFVTAALAQGWSQFAAGSGAGVDDAVPADSPGGR